MKIKKLRKQLKEFEQEHGNVEVIFAGYGYHDSAIDGIEMDKGFNDAYRNRARIW